MRANTTALTGTPPTAWTPPAALISALAKLLRAAAAKPPAGRAKAKRRKVGTR
jgi:hypothetical protein